MQEDLVSTVPTKIQTAATVEILVAAPNLHPLAAVRKKNQAVTANLSS